MAERQWAYRRAQTDIVCPHCRAALGQACRTPNGARIHIHAARIAAYRASLTPDELRQRHGVHRS